MIYNTTSCNKYIRSITETKHQFLQNATVEKTHSYLFLQDNNECENNKGGCDHNCHNNPGSFTCSCNSGYTLARDRLSCTGR